MRTEQDIMALILSVASSDERIRAVFMSGSRSNPSAQKDIYQDFDIAYITSEIQPFYNNPSWVEEKFGKPLFMQMPEVMRGARGGGHFNYQMIFTDGYRIDLSLVPLNAKNIKQYNSLTITLLDKDGIVPEYPPPTDKDYWLKEPDEIDFYSCCNNFWWCLNNVAKGIMRDELPYVMSMINGIVRSELHDMINWYIGTQRGFNLSTGKNGRFFKDLLTPELYSQYVATYSDGNYENIWKAVNTMSEMFTPLALSVAGHFGFLYHKDEEDGMRKYIKLVRGA